MSPTESLLVLVADDDEFVRKLLERVLLREGHQVVLASDGEAAIRTAIEQEPAVMFLDLRMPRLDGHSVLKELANAAVSTSIVVMSAHGGVDDVVGALRMGAVDYLRKPWTNDDMMTALQRAIDVSRALTDAKTAQD